jgi:IPT/TIG domain
MKRCLLLSSLLFVTACTKDAAPPVVPLAVTSYLPASGKKNTLVTIVGTGFSSIITENKVSFNDIAAAVTEASETKLIVKVPEGASTGKLEVMVAQQSIVAGDFAYITSVSVQVFAGANESGYIEGTGTAARFNFGSLRNGARNSGVLIDATDNLFIADTDNNCVRKITSTATTTTLYKNPNSTFLTLYGSASAIDQNGNFYVSDWESFPALSKISSAGSLINDFSSFQSTFLFHATGMATDKQGNVYASSGGLLKITPAGAVSEVVFSGGEFVGKVLTIDGANNLYTVLKPSTFGAAPNFYKVNLSNNSITPLAQTFGFAFARDKDNTLYINREGNVYKQNSQGIETLYVSKESIAPYNLISDIDGNGSYSDPGFSSENTSIYINAVDSKGNLYGIDAHKIYKIKVD